MSLFSSLYTSVSGLNAQQIAISNIAENVANASTVGYKGINTSFESLVFDNGNFQEPGDVEALSSYQNDVAGSLVQTQQATNLAINGEGFFVVKAPPTATANGVETFNAQDLYTRAGDFTVNANGYLVNSAGYTLEGYPVNSTTGAVAGTTAAAIQVPQSQNLPSATSIVSLLANLPSGSGIVGSSGYVAPSPVTETIYDSQGDSHSVSIQFNHTGTNTWTATLTAAGDTSNGGSPSSTVLDLTFGDGTTAPSGTLLSIAADPTSTGATPTIASGAAGTAATVSIPWNFGQGAQSVQLGFGNYQATTGLTQFAGTSVNVTSESQNGYAAGTLTGLSIDSSGYVNLSYTNGQTVKAFQVAVAQFNAPDQLDRIDGTAFQQTEASGNPIVGAPGANGSGSISPSTVEQSNVDISTELTKLITAQQVYSSNARVITVADQMLQTLNQTLAGA
jgi:flagellar hook protein FlgE